MRVRSRGRVLLITGDDRSIPATICDVSVLGMRVETSEELALGLPIRIEVHGIGAMGVVRYCVRKDSRYQIGVSLDCPTVSRNHDGGVIRLAGSDPP